jgi:NAD(P)H-nitrite reductase large subunit
MKYIIIGNGIAGIQAAETIRKMDSEGAITMIGDETFSPYCRPMISLVLEGAIHLKNWRYGERIFMKNSILSLYWAIVLPISMLPTGR